MVERIFRLVDGTRHLRRRQRRPHGAGAGGRVQQGLPERARPHGLAQWPRHDGAGPRQRRCGDRSGEGGGQEGQAGRRKGARGAHEPVQRAEVEQGPQCPVLLVRPRPPLRQGLRHDRRGRHVRRLHRQGRQGARVQDRRGAQGCNGRVRRGLRRILDRREGLCRGRDRGATCHRAEERIGLRRRHPERLRRADGPEGYLRPPDEWRRRPGALHEQQQGLRQRDIHRNRDSRGRKGA